MCKAGKNRKMETIFYIVCYQYFDGRKDKKANACFKQSELICDQYSNALREIERLLGDKEDLLILSVSRVETVASDADAGRW